MLSQIRLILTKDYGGQIGRSFDKFFDSFNYDWAFVGSTGLYINLLL